MTPPNSVLILGSAPSALSCRLWPAAELRAQFSHLVAVNNAWQIRPDWDIAIYPEDFPPERRPLAPNSSQRCVEAGEYVPANNAFGGVFYAGGTMAFTAGYWALHALRPARMAFLGCDMIYEAAPDGRTHFYGQGTADPLREDPSLRNLEAKSARLWLHAAQRDCAVTRLTGRDLGEPFARQSRLVFPAEQFSTQDARPAEGPRFDAAANAALIALKTREEALDYCVPSGRYWEAASAFDLTEIDALDAGWLAAYAALRGQASA